MICCGQIQAYMLLCKFLEFCSFRHGITCFLLCLSFQLLTVLAVENKSSCPQIFCILKERQGSFKETILILKLRMICNGDKWRLSAMSLYPVVRSKQKDTIIKLQMGAETVTCH